MWAKEQGFKQEGDQGFGQDIAPEVGQRFGQGIDQAVDGEIIAVTNRRLCERPFMEQLRRVCKRHPRALMLREKDLSDQQYKALAMQVMPLCEEYGVRFIPHSHPAGILDLGCRYLHLPLPLLRIHRAEIPRRIWLGCSVHSIEQLREAEQLGAAYVIAGHIYATQCKQGIPPRGPEFLKEICSAASLPVYAIGGIKLDQKQFAQIKACGARGGCIMSEMMMI